MNKQLIDKVTELAYDIELAHQNNIPKELLMSQYSDFPKDEAGDVIKVIEILIDEAYRVPIAEYNKEGMAIKFANTVRQYLERKLTNQEIKK